ncbi:hypothetical protein NXV86_07360 [Bacteroides sp. BFG-257]|nr:MULTISPECIES: hypothetical protein [Bacteroides]UBD71152.1 hypothetical protein K6V21_06985 [Bacteroides cellulosilyticus]UVO99784.1 hypothetical protein NXV86_07360 [Bacteroides sp. BFG-257]
MFIMKRGTGNSRYFILIQSLLHPISVVTLNHFSRYLYISNLIPLIIRY